MKTKLQIKDIVRATGVDRETLRFYEQKGLLPQAERTEAGYRLYDEEVITRLEFIKLSQSVGFTLKEIAELLQLGEDRPLTKRDLNNIAKSKIASLDQRIQSLQKMRSLLAELSSRASQVVRSSSCPVLSQFKKLGF